MSEWLILGAAAAGATYGIAKKIRKKIDERRKEMEYWEKERERVAKAEERSREYYRQEEKEREQEKIRRKERHAQLEKLQESGVDVCFRCQASEPELCESGHCIKCYDRCRQCGKCLGCDGSLPRSYPYCKLHN